MSGVAACERCLRRAWLVGRLAGHIEPVRARVTELLALGDEDLLAALGGDRRNEVADALARFDAGEYRRQAASAGLALLCRCARQYPIRLAELRNAPAVLHIAGDADRFLSLAAGDPVAIVGARRGSPYGREVASSLARALATAGVTVVSGMALGIDGAAHRGALDRAPATIAVLPSGADRAYPAGARALYRRIVREAAAVSELPPGCASWRWTFIARNRIIAGLAAMTVIVEATDRSGALTTARVARELGRPVGAVPGNVTSPLSAGPNDLLAGGATLVTGAQKVLDELFGVGVRQAAGAGPVAPLPPDLRALKELIGAGLGGADALREADIDPSDGLAAFASLELAGHIRRGPGGRYTVVMA
ncbi:MAG TPA: DNA-processing protein DprA [Solirubrobacteraceae bacterium]|nr:DNA-processing protein DprA [Solirubrobacteraceae bacterium]